MGAKWWVPVIAVALSLAIAAFLYGWHLWAIDACLDDGGSWDYSGAFCRRSWIGVPAALPASQVVLAFPGGTPIRAGSRSGASAPDKGVPRCAAAETALDL